MRNARTGTAGPGAGGGAPRGGESTGGHGGSGHDGPGQGPGGRGGPLPGAEIFSFEVSDGVVTSAARTINGNTIPFSDNADGEFTLKGDDIVLTRTLARGQEIIVFSDDDADSLYAIAARARVHTTAPTTSADGVVHAHQLTITLDPTTSAITEVSHVLRDGTTRVIQGDDLSFVLDQGLLIATHTSDSGNTRWEIFRDGNADGRYTEVAQGFGELVDLGAVVNLTEPNIELL